MIWLTQLVFDCEDPDAVMQFWGQALQYRNPMIGASSEEIATFRQEFPQFDGRGRIDDNELRRTPVYIHVFLNQSTTGTGCVWRSRQQTWARRRID